MKTTIRAGAAALAFLCAAPSHAAAVDVKGRWVVDMTAVVAQARVLKQSEADVATLKKIYQGAVMVIDADTMKLTTGAAGSVPIVLKYKVKSHKDHCVTVQVEAAKPTSFRQCIEDGALFLYDPGSSVIVVHRRQ